MLPLFDGCVEKVASESLRSSSQNGELHPFVSALWLDPVGYLLHQGY
jgi:hypothetical protein